MQTPRAGADHPEHPDPAVGAHVGERGPYGSECEKGHTEAKGSMKVKGPTEVNFKHGGCQKTYSLLSTFKMMAPPLNVLLLP